MCASRRRPLEAAAAVRCRHAAQPSSVDPALSPAPDTRRPAVERGGPTQRPTQRASVEHWRELMMHMTGSRPYQAPVKVNAAAGYRVSRVVLSTGACCELTEHGEAISIQMMAKCQPADDWRQ